MKIEIFKSEKELYAKAAKLILEEIRKKPTLVLGLAAGKTPVPLYKNLVEANENGQTSFSHIKTFNLDEYVGIDQDHRASFYQFTRDCLFDQTDINQLETYGLNGVASDLKVECEHYESLIKAAGGIDFLILGLGTNGHIAFNEPGSLKTTRTRLVNLSVETKSKISKELFEHEEVPTQGLTIGIANALESKNILLIATGSSKAEAVKNCFEAQESAQWPASYLKSHPNCVVFLDALAAEKLNQKK